jgi:hypothetical protein
VEFEEVTSGIMFISNFMNFCPAILCLLNTYRSTLPLTGWGGLNWVRLGYVTLAHEQMIVNSGVINIPPHEFKQPSRRYY